MKSFAVGALFPFIYFNGRSLFFVFFFFKLRRVRVFRVGGKKSWPNLCIVIISGKIFEFVLGTVCKVKQIG